MDPLQLARVDGDLHRHQGHGLGGGSPKIDDNYVAGSEVANESLTSADVFDGSLTGGDITDGSIERVDLDEEAQGPPGHELRDDTTGEICNDGCTEGSLELPPGFYAIFGRITVNQEEFDEWLQVDCELTSAGVVFDRAYVFDDDEDLGNGTTLQMQGIRLVLDRGNVNLNCSDHDDGSVVGSHLNILAINLGLAFSSEDQH